MLEMTPLLITFIAFAVVAGGVVVVGRFLSNEASMQRRLPVPVLAAGAQPRKAQEKNLLSSLANKIDEKKFGVNNVLRTKLRRELMRAGYFSDEAIRYYVLARIG